MLLSFEELFRKYDLRINGVLHVGAHLGEEADLYQRLGIENAWWVEANPFVQEKLRGILEQYGHTLIPACVTDVDGGTRAFNVTNYDGMSSSIYEFGTHPTFSPDTVFEHRVEVTTRTIDSLVEQYDVKANFLNMDIQGAELLALKGATKYLEQVDYLMSEINSDEVYVGCARYEELDAFLTGFRRVETHWVGNQGWGDSMFIRKSLL
jgi:FkbM family methyltransferase